MFACKKIPTLCVAVLLTLACAQLCHGQGAGDDVLARRVKAFTLKEPNINLALSAIAREYRVPIGVEMAAKGKGYRDKEIDIAISDGTLRDVLNAVIEADPRYVWRTTDGVVNVYPKAERDELLKDLLETKVQNLSFGNNPTLYKIRNSIVELPEIKSKLERARVTPFIVAITGVAFERPGGGFSMSVSDLTLQEVLNHVIKQSEVKFWILNRFGDDNELLVLNF